jgi:hypothetical protein
VPQAVGISPVGLRPFLSFREGQLTAGAVTGSDGEGVGRLGSVIKGKIREGTGAEDAVPGFKKRGIGGIARLALGRDFRAGGR